MRKEMNKMIFWSRIGYFAFWTGLSTSIFGGVILYMLSNTGLTPTIIVMIASALILALLDGYRSVKTRKIWIDSGDGVKFSTTIVLLEIVILSSTSALAIITH